jgi:hypothetical protein
MRRTKLYLRKKRPYEYDQLPRDNFFRYLVLQPGKGNEPLIGNLRTASLSDTTFEAISYVWGSSKKSKRIICDDRVIKITTNLSKVLRRLRCADTPRDLWADGICINQKDLEEKGYQVAIMGQIYRSAERVLIYISSDDDGHGPQLCSLLDDVNSMIDLTCQQIDMSSWDSFPYPCEDDPILVDTRWSSLHHLLGQTWFRRGWVVREAAVTHNGQVLWGQHEFTWNDFMRVYIWLLNRALRPLHSALIIERTIGSHISAYKERYQAFVQMFYDEESWEPQSLLQDLQYAKLLQLSDPRDRIYAFIELVTDSPGTITIRPDYNTSFLEVYRQITTKLIQTSRSVAVLDQVVHAIDTVHFEIPSWVVRWDVPQFSVAGCWKSNEAYLSSRDGSAIEPTLIDDTTLNVRGVVLDMVTITTRIYTWDTTELKDIFHLWKAVSITAKELSSPYDISKLLNAFLDTLCFSRFRGERLSWQKAKTTFLRDVRLEYEEWDETNTESPESLAVFDFIKSGLHGRRFIMTERGYMGVAPANTLEQDACAIIFGCKAPCILRSMDQEGSYRFLGTAFVMGSRAYEDEEGGFFFPGVLGHEYSKEWVDWDVEEQDIYLV